MSSSNLNPPPLAISLFGPMHALVHGRPIPKLRSRKALSLLALLTLRHGRPVEREWLAGTLWPDVDQRQAFANFRPVLSELRRALGSEAARLDARDRNTLQIHLAGADVDVIVFDSSIESSHLPSLEHAVRLYRGPLLEGCGEEWVFQERSIREHRCLIALQQLGESSLSAGDYSAATGYFQRAVTLDPWFETAQRGWMESLANSGDINAALHVYRKFAAFIKDDSKAVPDERTSALYQRLRATARLRSGDRPDLHERSTGSSAVKGYVPHPLTDLVGREDERLEVAAAIRRSRLVTLTGLGGVGKTRLAAAVAADVVREYADGVWLISLEAITDGQFIAHQIAHVLGIKLETGRDLLRVITEHLREKRLLLVLDNCEHLLDESARVAASVLRDCMGVRILTTSREPLGITGEVSWMVPSLAAPVMEHLPEAGGATLPRVLMGYESVQLFVERSQAVNKSFAVTRSNARAVALVCSQLDGIPLALELAAAWTKSMTVEQIAERLHDELGLLVVGSRVVLPRQQTLRATLDWSYALLKADEQRLLQRMSVFAGGWQLEAAEQVCAVDSIEASSVLSLLTSLIDKSLVVFAEQNGEEGKRYRLMEMVRQYAAERLQASGEQEAIWRRHRDWCTELAEEVGPSLTSQEAQTSIRRIQAEHDNLRIALKRYDSIPDSTESCLRIAGALGTFWDYAGCASEGRVWLGRILEGDAATLRSIPRAMALFAAGHLAYIQGDSAAARDCASEGLAISRELDHLAGVARGLNALGLVAAETGAYPEARALHEECLDIQRELESKTGIGTTLNSLGNIAYLQADYDAARTMYEQSLAMRRELGVRMHIATTLNNLALVSAAQSDYASAWALHEESLGIRRELGYKQGIAYSLNNLGNVAMSRGDLALARSLYEESLAIRRKLEDQRGIAESLANIGDVCRQREDTAESRASYTESIRILRTLGNKRGIAAALAGFAELSRLQGDLPAAATMFEESLDIRKALGDCLGIADALAGLGAVARDQGDHLTAQALCTESLQGFRDTRNLQGVANGLDALSAAAEALLEPYRAVCLFSASVALRERIGAPLAPAFRRESDDTMARARSDLGANIFEAAWEAGSEMTTEQAIELALHKAAETPHVT